MRQDILASLGDPIGAIARRRLLSHPDKPAQEVASMVLTRVGAFLQPSCHMTTDRGQPSCSCARVLLAEDDGDLRMLLALKLQDSGFSVTEACDGKDLLERLIDAAPEDGGAELFDIILSDINMPHFNALDVMVGARSHLITTPVVLMTSFADAHTREQARRLGVSAVLDKPLRLDDVSATLLRILNDSARQPKDLH